LTARVSAKLVAPSPPTRLPGPYTPTDSPTFSSRALPEPIAALGVSRDLETPRRTVREAISEAPQLSDGKGLSAFKGSMLFAGLSDSMPAVRISSRNPAPSAPQKISALKPAPASILPESERPWPTLNLLVSRVPAPLEPVKHVPVSLPGPCADLLHEGGAKGEGLNFETPLESIDAVALGR
jgi:hypothetical protein